MLALEPSPGSKHVKTLEPGAWHALFIPHARGALHRHTDNIDKKTPSTLSPLDDQRRGGVTLNSRNVPIYVYAFPCNGSFKSGRDRSRDIEVGAMAEYTAHPGLQCHSGG